MSYDSRGSERGDGVCVGIHNVFSCWVVHVLNDGFGAVVLPFVVGVGGEDWWALKFARREEVSSVFDFSKACRRTTDGPPDIMFL